MRLALISMRRCFFTTLVVGLSSVAVTSAAVEVRLRERVTPKSSVVRLEDVAEVASADRQLGRRLAAVPLMPAPAPNTERFLQRREITDMLAAAGLDVAEIRFDGPAQVAVVGKSAIELTAFNEPMVSKAVTHNDKRQAILAGASTRVDAAPLTEPQSAALRAIILQIVGDYVKAKSGAKSAGKVNCNVSDRHLAQLALATAAPVCSGGNAPWTGRQNLVLSFSTPNGPAHVPVCADVAEPPIAAVVAMRAVARGGVITAADVELRMVEPSNKTNGARVVIDNVEKIIGHEARQVLQAGDIVFADAVRSPLLVKRGELITVASQGGGIRVSTSAKALQDGARGDLIQVEAPDSKQRYDVRIDGLRQASIFTPTRVTNPKRAEQAQATRTTRPG